MIDEILLFLAKKVGHAGGGEHIYIYMYTRKQTSECKGSSSAIVLGSPCLFQRRYTNMAWM